MSCSSRGPSYSSIHSDRQLTTICDSRGPNTLFWPPRHQAHPTHRCRQNACTDKMKINKYLKRKKKESSLHAEKTFEPLRFRGRNWLKYPESEQDFGFPSEQTLWTVEIRLSREVARPLFVLLYRTGDQAQGLIHFRLYH